MCVLHLRTDRPPGVLRRSAEQTVPGWEACIERADGDDQTVQYVLGLDFGGTKLAAGLVDSSGRLIEFRRCPTDPSAGPAGAISAVQRLVDSFTTRVRLAGVGISFGGPIDQARMRTLLSHHGPGWEEYPLVEHIGRLWPGPVVMENDANAAALGEFRFGAGRGYRNLLYVTVSTGIGGGVIINGELYRGSRGLSGEIGHTIVVPSGPLCPCGKQGCLEAVASGPSIARHYAARSGLDPTTVTAEEVFQQAERGNPRARETLEWSINLLGIGLANAINLLDPDAIIIGGGVSRAGDRLFAPLRAAVAAAAAPSPPGAVPILPAALGDAVGVLGAAALVLSTSAARQQSAQTRQDPGDP
jgi:glucokinase